MRTIVPWTQDTEYVLLGLLTTHVGCVESAVLKIRGFPDLRKLLEVIKF